MFETDGRGRSRRKMDGQHKVSADPKIERPQLVTRVIVDGSKSALPEIRTLASLPMIVHYLNKNLSLTEFFSITNECINPVSLSRI